LQSHDLNAASIAIKPEEKKTLFDVRNDRLGENEKPDYFNARATIIHIKSEKFCYPGCPADGCNKKVTEVNGEWRCEKCKRAFERPKYR
jgi:replication factor A1